MTAESLPDNVIRFSARKRRRKRHLDDSGSADESTANRIAESPADEPPRKQKRGRPRKITEAQIASLPRSSINHQSPHSSTSPGPPTEKNFTKSSNTPSRASTSAIPSGGLGEELGDLGEDHSDTRSHDRSSGRAQASLLLQQVSPGLDEDETSTAFTMNTSQTQDAEVSYYRAATGEDVTQEPGTREPSYQDTFEETLQLGRRLQSYYARCASQTQAKADMVNRAKVLVEEESEQEALRKRATCQDEKVASLRSMLQEEERAMKKRAAEIEREGIELLRRN